MPRKKHKKIEAVREFKNVFDYKSDSTPEEIRNLLKGKTAIVELGCGHSEYTINLAKMYPEKIIIGVDRKPSRIYNGAKLCNENKIVNAAFMICYAEKLDEFFPKESVSEIWITFPDPYPRRSSMKKRLTHPRFLEIYKNVLVQNGIVNLKTDDNTLFNYTLKIIEEEKLKLIRATDDLYMSNDLSNEEKILTKYERQHLVDGKKIKLITFSF
jgi:tRNA (guanine-N7-)-methyltransferase